MGLQSLIFDIQCEFLSEHLYCIFIMSSICDHQEFIILIVVLKNIMNSFKIHFQNSIQPIQTMVNAQLQNKPNQITLLSDKQLINEYIYAYKLFESNQNYEQRIKYYKNKLAGNNLHILFVIVNVLRNILSYGNVHTIADLLKADKIILFNCNYYLNQRAYLLIAFINKLLALRFIKETYFEYQYAFVRLIHSQITNTLLPIAKFLSQSEDEERGKHLFNPKFKIFQPTYSNNWFSQPKKTNSKDLELIGFSIHKLTLEIFTVTGRYYKIEPSQQLLNACLKDRDDTDLENSFSVKFKQMNELKIKFPCKFHYFKNKQLPKMSNLYSKCLQNSQDAALFCFNVFDHLLQYNQQSLEVFITKNQNPTATLSSHPFKRLILSALRNIQKEGKDQFIWIVFNAIMRFQAQKINQSLKKIEENQLQIKSYVCRFCLILLTFSEVSQQMLNCQILVQFQSGLFLLLSQIYLDIIEFHCFFKRKKQEKSKNLGQSIEFNYIPSVQATIQFSILICHHLFQSIQIYTLNYCKKNDLRHKFSKTENIIGQLNKLFLRKKNQITFNIFDQSNTSNNSNYVNSGYFQQILTQSLRDNNDQINRKQIKDKIAGLAKQYHDYLTVINGASKVDAGTEDVILVEEKAEMQEIEQVFSERGSKIRQSSLEKLSYKISSKSLNKMRLDAESINSFESSFKNELVVQNSSKLSFKNQLRTDSFKKIDLRKGEFRSLSKKKIRHSHNSSRKSRFQSLQLLSNQLSQYQQSQNLSKSEKQNDQPSLKQQLQQIIPKKIAKFSDAIQIVDETNFLKLKLQINDNKIKDSQIKKSINIKGQSRRVEPRLRQDQQLSIKKCIGTNKKAKVNEKKDQIYEHRKQFKQLIFLFTPKLKRQFLKNKFLLGANSKVQVGVIFNLSEGFYVNPKDQNLTIKKFRLEMSLYITPLYDLKSIQIEIQHPTWLYSKSSLKHLKEKLAKDTQYCIPIAFELKMKNYNYFTFNYSNLPTIRIASVAENSCQVEQLKEHVPLLVTRFSYQKDIEEEYFIQLLNNITLGIPFLVSEKLIRHLDDVRKYFSNFTEIILDFQQKMLLENKTKLTLNEKIIVIKIQFLRPLQSLLVIFYQSTETRPSRRSISAQKSVNKGKSSLIYSSMIALFPQNWDPYQLHIFQTCLHSILMSSDS